jgi:protein-tyrosine phosphatase
MTYRIALVCLGNICRSPIAEVVVTARLEEAGLGDAVEVVSAGTGDWHVGDPMDRRAAAVLTAHGYDASRHRAQQVGTAGLDTADLVLAMDADNHADLLALTELGLSADKLRMFRDYDPRATDADRDVPDPYYGGDDGFDTVLALVERTATGLVAALQREVARS